MNKVLVATVFVSACTVNGKPFNPFSGGDAPQGAPPASPDGQAAAAGGEAGWGGTPTTAKVTEPAKVVPRCQNGKKYFLGAAEQYPGHGVQSVVVADMNGDGKADIVTGNPHGTKPAPPHHAHVGVMLGNGDGTFATMALYGVGLDSVPGIASPDQLTVADLDGDRAPELVFSAPGYGGADPQYVPNNGDGTLGEQVSLHANDVAGTALVADFNGDGKNDIVIENYLWLNGGKKHAVKFAGKTKFNETWDRGADAAADFDGDGAIDIASTEDGVKIYANDGNGSFTVGTPYKLEGVKHVRAGDFDGDGKADLAVLGQSVGIMMNKGGALGAPAYYKFPASWDSTAWLLVADLNGDARADVVVGDPYEGVAVYMNDGKGALGSAITLPAGRPNQIAAGDFTGDHALSLVVVDDSQSSDESKSNIYVLHAACR